MNKSLKNTIAILCIASLFKLLGMDKHYNQPPASFHLGAQTDRASLVLNYANSSTSFLYPKIMETRLSDGIVGCEFPGLYYLIAQIFKQTGFNYAIYRLIIFGFYLLGIWSMFQIGTIYLPYRTALIISLLIGFSPILTFYGLNFLPDVPAFGLSMLGWLLILRNKRNQFSLVLGFLIFGLAGLLKASYAVHLAVAFSVFIIANKKIKWQVLLTSIVSMASIAAWYEWATFLNEKFQNPHFLLKPNPANGFPEFLNLLGNNWRSWASELYLWPSLLLMFFGIYAIFKLKTSQVLLFKITMRLTILWLVFYLAFQVQFRYHDYYFIAVIPLLFFLCISATLYFKEKMHLFIFANFFLCFLAIQNFVHTQKQFAERYKITSYYYQPPMPGIIEKYIGIDSFINKHCPKGAQLITVFDETPNSTLFFARRKGARIANDFSEDLILEIINQPQFDFIMVNDTAAFMDKLSETDYKLKPIIAAHNGIYLYQK